MAGILLAVDDHGPVLGVGVVVHDVAHPPPELEEGVGEGVGVARPLGVVEQDHLALLAVLPHPDGADHEVGQLLLVLHGHAHATVHLLAIFARRPVLNTHHLELKKTLLETLAVT